MNISSSQIVYSEHGEDECFEYKNEKGRVPDGTAIGYVLTSTKLDDQIKESLILFDDIKYSKYDHKYWDDYDLESDINRVFL